MNTETLSSNWSGSEESSQLGVFSAIELLRGAKCIGYEKNGLSSISVLRTGDTYFIF